MNSSAASGSAFAELGAKLLFIFLLFIFSFICGVSVAVSGVSVAVSGVSVAKSGFFDIVILTTSLFCF